MYLIVNCWLSNEIIGQGYYTFGDEDGMVAMLDKIGEFDATKEE